MVQTVIVAVGGASCSGKTTLVKHLARIIGERAFILHQDDYAPPAHQIPIHPVRNIQDWDDPETAVDWKVMRKALAHLREFGTVPVEHQSHDHLNLQTPVPIAEEISSKWKQKFEEKDKTAYILLDGFLLYYDQQCVENYNVKILLREKREVLKHRREERNGYFLTSQTDQERVLWKDPENYFDNIVWPAYTKAHKDIFDGDLKTGPLQTANPITKDMLLLETSQLSMGEMVEKSCESILAAEA